MRIIEPGKSFKTIRGKEEKISVDNFFERGRLRIIRKKKTPRKVVLLL